MMSMFSMFSGVTSRACRARRTFAPSLEQVEDRQLLTVSFGPLNTITLDPGNKSVTASQVFTNTGSTPTQVSIAVYQIQDPSQVWTSQVYVDSKTVTLAPGETETLSLKVKCGAYQFDSFEGSNVLKAGQFTGYPHYDFPQYASRYQFFLVDCDCNGKIKGNEGLGNGVDPPPPGHADMPLSQNDNPPSTPGSPNKGWNNP